MHYKPLSAPLEYLVEQGGTPNATGGPPYSTLHAHASAASYAGTVTGARWQVRIFATGGHDVNHKDVVYADGRCAVPKCTCTWVGE